LRGWGVHSMVKLGKNSGVSSLAKKRSGEALVQRINSTKSALRAASRKNAKLREVSKSLAN